jgi:hypothetical protein
MATLDDAKGTKMKTHAFASSADAYDACQCDDNISNGDLLDIEAEGIVGLAWTWPVAVTEKRGELHLMSDKPGGVGRVSLKAGWSEEQVQAAVDLASERGYELAEPFLDLAPRTLAP